MRSNLENRYRRLLRVLPAWYRTEREEEMVGLFLADRTDELDLEHGWPGWGETGATVALGVRTRFAASGAPARAVAVGDVVRLIALFGVLVMGAYAVRGMVLRVNWWPDGVEGSLSAPRPFDLFVALTDVVLLAASVAVVVGFRGVGKVLFGVMAVLNLARFDTEGPLALLLGVLWQVPLWLTTLALLAGFHRDAPTPALGRWRWALAGVVPGAAALTWVSLLVDQYALYRLSTMAAVPAVAVVVGLVHLLRRGGAVGALAIGVWIAALLPVEVLYTGLSGEEHGPLVVAMVPTCVVLLVVGLRELRRPALAVTP